MLITIFATLSLVTKPSVNVSVEGNGFFQFAERGRALYTSSAPLVVVNGWLSNPNGAPLLPTLRVPDGTSRIEVEEDGDVYATTPNFRARVGRISLATFRPGDDLRRLGKCFISSSMPIYKEPGEGNVGTIKVVDKIDNDPMRDPDPVPMPLAPAPTFGVPTRDDSFVREWIERVPSEPALPYTKTISGEAHISIATQTDCLSDRFTLGDIAVIDASSDLRSALMNAQIGDTPKPGKKMQVKKDAVLRELTKQGFDTEQISIDLPDRATVTRRGQEISADSIKDAAIQAASQLLGTDHLKANVHFDYKFAPLGDLTYTVESCVKSRRGATAIVVTNVNGQRYNSHVVRISK